jgi:hypothetical protein
MTAGNSFGASTMISSSSPSGTYTAASAANNAGVAANVGALNTASTTNAYFEFTLTPAIGYYVAVNGISFGTRSTATGPQAFSLRSSKDSYTTDLGSGSIANTSTWALKTPAVTSSGSSHPITYRIYGHSGIGSPGSGAVNWRVDDVILTLDVQQCVTPTIIVNSGAICTGNSFTISPSGGVTYSVSGGSYTVSPTANTNYTITGADIHGCENTAVSSVTVNALPSISVNSGAICSGKSFTMVPSGASTYTFSSGSSVVSPTLNTSYNVTATSALGCISSNTAVSSVTVNTLPDVSITGASIICSGNTTTLTASGATSYLWDTGATTTGISVSPTSNISYTVTGTNINGCINTAVNSVTVNNLPIVNITGTSVICSGNTTTLTASGATSYLWDTGATTTGISISPSTNTTYSVTGVDGNGCSNTAANTVTVNALPTVTVNSGAICTGQSFTMIPSGASTYTYSGGSNVVSPTVNSDYTVTATDANGCLSSVNAISSITVNALPIINVNASPMSICNGATSTLTGNGGMIYSWNTGATTSSILVTPGINTTYSVTGTDINGCSNMSSLTITITNCPGITQLTPASCGSTVTALDQYLNYNAVTGATNYRVEIICAQQSFNVTNIRNRTVPDFCLSWVPGTQYGRTYNIRVSAYVAGVWQPWGATCTVTTPSVIPTTQFSSGSCGVTLSSLNQLLNFNAIPGSTNYRMEITNASQPFSVVNVRNNTVTNFQMSWVTGIQYNRTYDVRISAYVAGAWGPYGSVCTITTPTTIPTTQLNVSSCGMTVSALNQVFNWTAVSGATNYKVEVANTTQPLNVLNYRNNNLTGFALSYVTGTTIGRTYDIRVASYVGGVWGNFGTMCQVTAATAKGNDTTGFNNLRLANNVSEEDIKELINIYPNPTSGEFTINLPSNRQIEITNILGEKIMTQFLFEGESHINIHEQPAGIYFVKVIQDGKQQVIKLIKD